MAPYYPIIAEELNVPVDQELLKSMEQANAEALTKLEEKIADAEQNLGETEVNDGLLAKAEHYAEIGDKVGRVDIDLRFVKRT
jgi:26S proteasome regulatory subunit N7